MTHRGVHLRPTIRANAVVVLLTVLLGSQAVDLQMSRAQAPNPITSSGLGTQVNLSATPPAGKVQYDITGGTRPGGGANLFHSFGEFGVPTNNIANFLNETALPTSNILGRVTGGNISNIFGTIQTTGFGNANLFLMNPAGFLFGPNATVNVGGMVAFTSADYLKLADNARFNAVPDGAADALLSTLPVASFGFLGSNPGAITVQGSQFSVTDGQNISLVGGNVTIQSGTLENGTPHPARLSVPNGNIQLASATSPGEFDAATLQPLPNVDGASFTSFGSIALVAGSSIDVSGASMVSIRGGQFVLSVNDAVLTTSQNPGPPETISLSPGSSIVTSNSGTDPGADVQLIASNAQMDGASITTLTFGPGRGGDVIVTAGTLQLNGESQISTQTDFVGRGGDLQLNVGTLTLKEGATLRTANNDFSGTTDAEGNVTLGVGGDITIQGLTGPGSDATDVTITGRGSFGFTSEIKAESNAGVFAFGPILAGGNGGGVMIASQSITLNDGKITSQTNFIGPGGDIDLGLRQLTISNGGQITSLTGSFDPGSPGGKITIHELAEGLAPSVALSGSGIDGLSGIFSLSNGNANPGDISITTGNLTLTDGAVISGGDLVFVPQGASVTIHASDSVHMTTGGAIFALGSFQDAGGLVITTPTLSMNQGLINTSTFGDGKAGDVTFNVRALTLKNGFRVESNSIGSGSAGSITVQGFDGTTGSRADSVTIGGQDFTGQPSGLFTETGKVGIFENPAAEGTAGNIFVSANSVTLQNGGTLSAKTLGTESTATGGNITIQGSDVQFKTGAIVTAETFGSGAGGKVTISADQRITVADSFILTGAIPELGEGGAGGDIVLNAPTLSLERSGLFASTSSTGKAGDVALQGQQITLVSDTVVATSTDGQGAAGTIKVEGLQGPGSRATSVALSNSRIESETVGNLGSEGHAGSIVMETARLTLTDSQLSTRSSFSQGSAGQLVVNASDQIQLVRSNITSSSEGGVTDAVTGDPLQTGDAGEIVMRAPHISIEDASTVTTSTEFNGQGGDINIVAGQSVTLNNGSSISASSSGAGNAGNILINAGQNYTSTDSTVTTQAAQASGGNITVLATDTVQLTNNSQLNASVQGSSTTVGGNITIDPQYVILQDSHILANATHGQGGAISITITNGGLFLPDANSTVSASSQFGVNGTVTIQSPNAPASGKIQPLGKTPLLATSLLNQRCAALAGGEFSSFTVAGRDSLPTEPGRWLASPLATLNAGMGLGVKAEGVRPEVRDEEPEGETALLSLRQIAPAGFLTQAFALDWLTGCQS